MNPYPTITLLNRKEACAKMGHQTPCGHPTMNATMPAGNPHPRLDELITKGALEMANITCKACNKPANGLLKTPTGWVCGTCFKLIYSIPTRHIEAVA